MKIRPCIDLHAGTVKQIVGSTLIDDDPSQLKTNFIADKTPSWFAAQYRQDNLTGGHIIKLGPGNDRAAEQALAAWPGGMQIGGGITADNAALWLEKGASHVIVTSWVFSEGQINWERLKRLVSTTGKEKLVLDLSCRRHGASYYIITDHWQKFTDVRLERQTLEELASWCDEFLIHAADVEGKCSGIETDLVALLGASTPIPTTYAGGIHCLHDLEVIRDAGQGRLDATIGSALDLFGGTGIRYRDAVAFHKREEEQTEKEHSTDPKYRP